MTLYLTPDRYRTMGFGSKLARFEGQDIELASILARASGIADAYCAVPVRPQRHSFLGGTITDEQHSWRLSQTPFESTQRRLYPYHTPVRTVTRFRIYVTQPDPDVDDGQYVTVDPADIMVNRMEDYLEVVSSAMTSTGLFNALIVPAIYLAAPIATASYTYGYRFAVSDEPVYPVDGLTYQSQNNYWTDAAVAVYVNGTLVPSGYTIDRTEGTVTFDAPPALGTVTVDYTHKLPVEIRDAVGYIASHLIESANLTARGMAELTSLEIAGQIKATRAQASAASTDGARSYVDTFVPQAGLLLADFSNWRVAA